MKKAVITFGLAVLLCGVGAVLATESARDSGPLLFGGTPSVHDVHRRCEATKTKDCVHCHPKAATSRWASERLVPKMTACAECHEAARGVTVATPINAQCRVCHASLEAGKRPVRGNYPRPNIRFSHAAHKTAQCSVCHPRAAARKARGASLDAPTMRKCFDCHGKGKTKQECRTCHIVEKDGRIVTQWGGELMYPPEWLKGPTHGPEWVSSHAETAGADSGFCGTCHRESYCRDCHTGRRRPRKVHSSDWMARHGIGIRMDTPSCKGCHRKQSFCITCHRRAGVAPDSPAGARPPGHMGRYHGGMTNTELMRRARRDITSCVACHSESSCITCHATRNPHPPGWSRKCKPLASRNRRACVKCHSDEAWKRCQ